MNIVFKYRKVLIAILFMLMLLNLFVGPHTINRSRRPDISNIKGPVVIEQLVLSKDTDQDSGTGDPDIIKSKELSFSQNMVVIY